MSKLDLIAPDSPEAALSRRSLVQTIAGTALAMTFLAGCGGSDDNDNNNGNNSTNVDQAVLQFALHLEYLEAEFYSYAVNGTGIEGSVAVTGQGTAGATTGGAKTNFSNSLYAEVAAEIARDELEHVRLLRTALGGAVIAKPAININPLGLDLTTEAGYITLARAFEDVGVTAYLGAAPLLSKGVLTTAAAILAVEALHTGNLRYQAVAAGTTGPQLDSKDQLPNSADPLTGASQNFFAVNGNGLAFSRSPFEVLRIVLNQPNATTASQLTLSGGFFPSGLNLTGNNGATLLGVAARNT